MSARLLGVEPDDEMCKRGRAWVRVWRLHVTEEEQKGLAYYQFDIRNKCIQCLSQSIQPV